MAHFANINQLDPDGTHTYADYLAWQFSEEAGTVPRPADEGKPGADAAAPGNYRPYFFSIRTFSPIPDRMVGDLYLNAIRSRFGIGCAVILSGISERVRQTTGNETIGGK